MLEVIKENAKAIAAALATLIVALAAKYGFDVDVNAVGILVSLLLVGVTTHQIPNKPKADAPADE